MTFSMALSAFINNIPIVHFCGGSDTLDPRTINIDI